MTSITNCLLCGTKISGRDHEGKTDISNSTDFYYCNRCSYVYLTNTAASVVVHYSYDDKIAISITLRNEWERAGKKISKKNQKSSDDLKRIIKQFRPLDPLAKMDHALKICDKIKPSLGESIPMKVSDDYPYFNCKNSEELIGLFGLLFDEGFIKGPDPRHPTMNARLTAKGYQRLREIQRPNQESNQCFVAMWFGDEVKNAFDDAIKPAIEYLEPNETESKFKAIKIDNVEHANDINDEIIAQIRRSRFMVCDLTGYRGGVYFEAGFAYGLGLDVIYTCRKDWTKLDPLKNAEGKAVTELFDSKGKAIKIQKEGVHFDLAHRNRIDWDPNDLDDFKNKLERRIKAIIY